MIDFWRWNMDFISVQDAAKNWGISERRIQKLCEENRIEGAVKFSRLWLIPRNAQKPSDRRRKELPKIENIIESYGQYVYNLALKLSANPEYADDLTQETFIKAWLHIKELRSPEAIKKWLRIICINEFRMSLRKQQRENNAEYFESIEELERDGKLLVTPPSIQLDEVEANEEVIKLRDGCFLAMTRKLSLNQRIAFSLVDMFGLSIKEVSEILDITPKAVKGLLYRARLNLESFFQGHCSFLDINNPCTCKEWIEFMNTRNSIQKKMRQSLTVLNYKQNGYVQNTKTTQMILHYYHNIPDQRPSQKWFDGIILLVKKFYGNC